MRARCSSTGCRGTFTRRADAQAAGVGMVHQELAFCPDLTVAENLSLGQYPAAAGHVRGSLGHAGPRAWSSWAHRHLTR